MHNVFFFIFIINVDRFHKKQEHDFGLDGWSVEPTPKKNLTQDEKSDLVNRMRELEKKAAMLKGQTCPYHQAVFDIRSIKLE